MNGNLRIGIIAVNTMLAGAFGSVAAMGYTWLSGAKKPDIGMMGNGLLAGLVAITAPSGYVSPLFAAIIGTIAGVIVVFMAGVIEKVWKVDDPVGAIAVHGFNGAWGQLAVGLFADGGKLWRIAGARHLLWRSGPTCSAGHRHGCLLRLRLRYLV